MMQSNAFHIDASRAFRHKCAFAAEHVQLLSKSGKATQKPFLSSVAAVMGVIMKNMDMCSRKVGKAQHNGFVSLTWQSVENLIKQEARKGNDQCDMSHDVFKRAKRFILQRGFVESVQPRERYIDRENRVKYAGLASIKRVTLDFFDWLGLAERYQLEKERARLSLKANAKKLGTSIKRMLTPVTMLQKWDAVKSAKKVKQEAKTTAGTGIKEQRIANLKVRTVESCEPFFIDSSGVLEHEVPF